MAQLKRGLWVGLVVVGALLAACSPEASRTRGQPGADIHNVDATIELHGNADSFFGTPSEGQAVAVEKAR